MMWTLQYAFQRLWRVRLRLVIMSLFLSLGFFGWLTGESAKTSIRGYLAQNAKQILSADITVSARRELKEEELQVLTQKWNGKGEWIKGYEFFGMMTAGTDTRLVLVRVVEDAYPFYGELKLEIPGKTPDLRGQKLWAYDEFKSLFDIQLNQVVKLGESDFTLTNFVSEDKTQTFRLASLAPRVFIHMQDLEKTKLIQFGSTFTATYFFKAKPDQPVALLATELKKSIPDPGVDISNAETLPEEESDPTQRLSDFLGLTSLVALLFSALSLFYLLQVWSLEQQKERGFLRSLGVTNGQLFFLEVFQSVAVAFLSTAVSVGLLLVTKPLIEAALVATMKTQFVLNVSAKEVVLILVSQLALLLALSNPFSRLNHTSVLQLLKNNFVTQQAGLLRFTPLFLLLWPYSIYASQSFRNGSYFFFSLLFIALCLVFFGKLVLFALSKWNFKSWLWSLAAKSLNRQSTASWAFLFTVGLSSALLNLIPQIQSSLENLLSFDELKSRPSLFLFDIQSEQWPDLKLYFEEQSLSPTAVSPMVRARILKINDELYERKELTGSFKSREEEESARSRNRGVNMTYRSSQQSGEKVIEGLPITQAFQEAEKHPGLSIEKRYADRMNLKLQDLVTFDVQGIEIQARVQNIREVKWSRFEPNFFVVMQEGVLNDAPQTLLASLPFLEKQKKSALIRDMAKKFSNVSVIDVERLMDSIVQNLKRVSGALNLMTYLTLLTGLMTLVFLLTAEAQRRAFEIHLIRVLGAQSSDLTRYRLLEVSLLSLISVLVGVGSSFVIAYVIINQVFQVSFTSNTQPAILIVISVLLVCWLVTWITSRRQLKQSSFQFLKRDE